MWIWRDSAEIIGQVCTVVIMIVLCDQYASMLLNAHVQFYKYESAASQWNGVIVNDYHQPNTIW